MIQAGEIMESARGRLQDLVAIRRHLHAHPELSFEEHETSRYVQDALESMGIPCRTGLAGTGLAAEIGPFSDRCVAMRADMDALPILEANDVPYRSRNEGVMHACGHDVHTTCLLGAAAILKGLEDRLPHGFRLIFQPAEERFPGGASAMIREGVLQNPVPAAVLGQHVHPPLHVGMVGFGKGPYMACADEVRLTVKGRGGHVALPQDCIDPVAIASSVYQNLQYILSRRLNPNTPCVLAFGKIESVGGAFNVIPNEVKLEGSFRTLDLAWRKEAHEMIRKIAEQTATGMGGACKVEIQEGYPPLVNDDDLTERSMALARELLGEENVVELPVRMSAEDFAYYAQVVPGCFLRLGTGNPSKGITSPIHTDTFDVDEECLVTGSAILAWLAVNT